MPFETALYLCHGAFAFLDGAFFRRTSMNGCFPAFAIAVLVVAALSVYSVMVRAYGGKASGLSYALHKIEDVPCMHICLVNTGPLCWRPYMCTLSFFASGKSIYVHFAILYVLLAEICALP